MRNNGRLQRTSAATCPKANFSGTRTLSCSVGLNGHRVNFFIYPRAYECTIKHCGVVNRHAYYLRDDLVLKGKSIKRIRPYDISESNG